MNKGVHLQLMIGPVAPQPAPKSVADALRRVQVTSGTDKSGFQLQFSVGKQSPLLTTLLPAGFFDPISTRVLVLVVLGGTTEVIMDGVVTQQELSPSNAAGESTLTVTGRDLSVLMDLVEMKRGFPALSDAMQCYEVLAPYLLFGIVPVVIPGHFPGIQSPSDTIPGQVGTDLKFLKLHAAKSGYVFYVEPGPLPGQSIAYLGPNIRIPVPQPALSVNMDAHTNVDQMSFSLNGTAKQWTIATVLDPITARVPIPLPIPDVNIFQPPLGLRPTVPTKVRYTREGAAGDKAEVLTKALGRMLQGAANAITVTGSLDVARYGHVLRARRLVGVRGAGRAYDGHYYVDSVTHTIERGKYAQTFSLSRDGLIAATDRV